MSCELLVKPRYISVPCKCILIPRYQTGGSVLAGKLAMERGWAINIGGGFHHCWGNKGGGFCAYADITLAIHFIFNYYPSVERVMIIDLDAHQVSTGKQAGRKGESK